MAGIFDIPPVVDGQTFEIILECILLAKVIKLTRVESLNRVNIEIRIFVFILAALVKSRTCEVDVAFGVIFG